MVHKLIYIIWRRNYPPKSAGATFPIVLAMSGMNILAKNTKLYPNKIFKIEKLFPANFFCAMNKAFELFFCGKKSGFFHFLRKLNFYLSKFNETLPLTSKNQKLYPNIYSGIMQEYSPLNKCTNFSSKTY